MNKVHPKKITRHIAKYTGEDEDFALSTTNSISLADQIFFRTFVEVPLGPHSISNSYHNDNKQLHKLQQHHHHQQQ